MVNGPHLTNVQLTCWRGIQSEIAVTHKLPQATEKYEKWGNHDTHIVLS